MKVAMLVNNLSVSGGYQKLVLRLSSELRGMGHNVTIYAARADKSRCYPDLFARESVVALSTSHDVLHQSRLTKFFRTALLPLLELKRYRSLAKAIVGSPDAVVIHDELCLKALFFLKKSHGQRICWMLNNELDPRVFSLGARIRGGLRRTSRPWVWVAAVLTMMALAIEWIATRVGVSRVDVFATYDAHNARAVHALFGRHASVVRAGADVEQFRKSVGGRKPRSRDEFRILSVGVFFPHRRYEDVIRAIGLARQRGVPVKAVIVGLQTFNREYAASIRSLADGLGCKGFIEFREYVQQKELEELYRESDAFVFVNDGFTWGIAVFEAIAASLPVVVTTNIGATELLKHKHTAWIVEPRQPEQIANSIYEIYSDETLRQRVAKSAITEILPLVSWAAYARRMEALLIGRLDGSVPDVA